VVILREQRSAPTGLRADHFVPGHREPYRPEIDGLRTIAVLSVFAFHLDARLLGGGFVGVDIFFVISGYLITNLLLNDIEGAKFSILRFYQRRIARIAPAAFLVVAITMIAGLFLYSAQDIASLGASGLAAALSFINMKLLFQVDYFRLSPDAQPLLHYWSLAVEEQFYVIFPLLLYGVMSVTRRPLAVLLACCAASFAACVIVTPLAPNAAFYLLPTRAWELLAGSNLAIARMRYRQLTEKQSSLCLAAGLVIVVLSFVFIRDDGFPGWMAALPVAGSTLMLAGIGNAAGFIQRTLAHPAMVFLGKRSYSLYLWHWPIFSFVDYQLYRSNPVFVVALKIIVTSAATLLSYRFVESPMRLWLNAPRRRGVAFGAFALAAIAIGVAGYAMRSNYYLSAEPRDVATGGILVNPKGHKWVVVIGDSQGAMYGYELALLAHRLDFRLNVLSSPAGNELPGEPYTLWPGVSRFLGDRKPDVLILAQAWSAKLGEDGRSHFRDALAAILPRATEVLVLAQPPVAPPNATRHAILAGARPPFFEAPTDTQNRMRANAIINSFQGSHTRILDVAGTFLNSDNSIRLIAPDGRVAFRDGWHLSESGTALVRPKLDQALRSMLNLPQAR
jgi:peptidoglycan/LPS O-acetylase OafA/YrhL